MQAGAAGGNTNINNSNSKHAPLDPMDVDPIDDGPRDMTTVIPPVPSIAKSPSVLQLAAPDGMVVETDQDAKQCLDWLRSEDLSQRVAAAHRLDAVARWLGPERTRRVSVV